MKTAQRRLRDLVSGIGLSIAIATAVVIPAGYYFQASADVGTLLSLQANLKAGRLAKYIYTHYDLWQYQAIRLAEIIEIPEANEAGSRQRIFEASGDLLLETGETPAFPIAAQSASIIVEGSEIGRIETATTFRPVLLGTAAAALLGVLLGIGIFFALRTLPLRVLDQTFDALGAETLRFQSALENMSQGLCMFDAAGRLVVANQRFAGLFGIPPEKLLPGVTEAELMGLSPGAASDSGAETLNAEPEAQFEDGIGLRRSNGNVILVQRRPMANGGEVVTYEDVTERRRAEARIAHMARYDGLTDLPNRLLFLEKLEQAVSRLGPGAILAVLFLDIDSFKSVNDTLGHAAGDDLLRAVSRRLCDAVRETDTVARLGGDEFAIVQTEVTLPSQTTALAVRLIEAIAAPFDIQGNQVVVGTSIGIALAPSDGTAPDVLLKNADLALYRVKMEGRGTYRYFEAEMDARMRLRRAIETDLRKAVAQGQLEMLYQPIVDVASEEIICCEALMRWNHPERGTMQPKDFIPVAEETGLIVPMGEWAIGTACKEAAGWPGDVKIAINLSPVQFKSRNLVPAVASALAASGLSPGRLELEITEAVLLQDNEHTLHVLHQLRDLGISISMDDFGTGYSSLSYLRKFPFDKIKIDGSFVQEMSNREDSLAIVRAVSAIGVSLGIVTTAEGVETREQFDRIKSEGCLEAQGSLFSKPQPAAQVKQLLSESARKARISGDHNLVVAGQ